VKPNNRALRLLAGATAVAASAAAAALSAAATPASAAACPPPPTVVQPFTPWQDANDYVMTTGGTFEPGAAPWTLSGGAAVASGNAPNALDSPNDSHSLYLPAGSSATSACVTAPLIAGLVRFFARNVGSTTGQLQVEILVKGRTYQAGVVEAGSSWAPTPILTSNAPAYKGAVTYQVRLTPVGAGAAFDVDDVYFDPYHSR